MKKFCILSFALLSLVSCSKKENESGNLHITGNIEGLSQGKLYIQQLKDTTLVVVDSIIFKGDSHFEKSIPLTEPEVLFLFLDRGQTNSIDNSLGFFAEPGEMTINTKLKEFYSSAKFTGSKNQELWEEFNTINKRFTEDNLSIMEKRLQNELNFNAERQDSIAKAYEKLLKRKYLYTANFASTHGEYEVAPYIALSEIANINITFLDTIASKMSPKVSESKYGKMLKEHIKDLKNNQ